MRWPHAPAHMFDTASLVMVTSGTYLKVHRFREERWLDRLQSLLFELALEHRFRLEAWAVFSNHYHFVAQAEDDGADLAHFIGRLHSISSKELNSEQACPGRRVWYQYWDTQLTFNRSILARLSYVHNNPVKHGLVRVARKYPWCSADWLHMSARRSFIETLAGFDLSKVKVPDDF
jgi:putative transposase